MISLDTNALVRVLIEDDKRQAKMTEETIVLAEEKSVQILITTPKKGLLIDFPSLLD